MLFIKVDDKGTELWYIDSGLPTSDDIPTQDYVTIFAIHLPAYSSSIFEKILALAPEAGLGFVAINRSDYPGSTPLSSEDLAAVTSGTEDTEAVFVRARGMEVVTIIEANALKPITSNGLLGGFALLWWSLGCAIALAAVAYLKSLDWATYLRVIILQESPSVAQGAVYPLQAWSTQIDQGALPLRHLAALTYVVPGSFLATTTFARA
ncbi:hypothetical protein C8Q80DRAFT_1270824 [Daedaleopsis nitida]|nr:hypothetical protein C8Q80DRAFT_1270824 [Daedaleopsis nitida]